MRPAPPSPRSRGWAASASRKRVDPRARSSIRPASDRNSIGACSVRSSSTWAARSTPASTNRIRRSPTRAASAPTSSHRSRTWACRSCAIPGGNFVSGYNWLDGVGPKNQRPTVLERAWNSIETNQFGTNEFIDWCKLVGTEPLLGMNFGTGTAEMAVAYVEYCNVDKGTKWSELRRSHGYDEPHNVRVWCLGQRDGRPLADGPHAGARLRPQGARHRRGRCASSIAVSAHRLRIEQHHPADVSRVGSRGARGVLRPGRRHLAAQLLRQHAGAHRRQHRALPGDEPRHGAADPRDRRGLRLRAGAAQVAQAAVAVVRRVERLVSRARPRRRRRQAHLRAEAARGGLQPRGRAARRRLPEHAAAAAPIASASPASRRSST